MPQLDMPIVTVDGNYKAFVPGLKFKIQLVDKNPASPEQIVGGNIDVNISIQSGSEFAWLGRFSFHVPAQHGNRLTQKDIEETFHLDLDANNAMLDLTRSLNGEDITFRLSFTGFILWNNSNNQNVLYTSNAFSPEMLTKDATLSVERWKKLISTYYRNLSWVAISRETYAKLKALQEAKGMTPDEILNELMVEKSK